MMSKWAVDSGVGLRKQATGVLLLVAALDQQLNTAASRVDLTVGFLELLR